MEERLSHRLQRGVIKAFSEQSIGNDNKIPWIWRQNLDLIAVWRTSRAQTRARSDGVGFEIVVKKDLAPGKHRYGRKTNERQ
jgi:hypothetical protein